MDWIYIDNEIDMRKYLNLMEVYSRLWKNQKEYLEGVVVDMDGK